jgi:YHS domain-containing protein
MRRLLFLLLAIVALFWWIRRTLAALRAPKAPGSPPGAPADSAGLSEEPMVRDRVCNTFLPRSRAISVRIGDEEQFFCSERCRETFLERSRA